MERFPTDVAHVAELFEPVGWVGPDLPWRSLDDDVLRRQVESVVPGIGVPAAAGTIVAEDLQMDTPDGDALQIDDPILHNEGVVEHGGTGVLVEGSDARAFPVADPKGSR